MTAISGQRQWRLRFWRLAARDWYYLYGVRIPLLQSQIRERMS